MAKRAKAGHKPGTPVRFLAWPPGSLDAELNPIGQPIERQGISEFCDEHKLDRARVTKLLAMPDLKYECRGWRFQRITARMQSAQERHDSKERGEPEPYAYKEWKSPLKDMAPEAAIRETVLSLTKKLYEVARGRTLADVGTSIREIQEARKAIVELAEKVMGLRESDLIDTRTEAQKADDAMKRLMSADGSLLEMREEEIEAVERCVAEAQANVDAQVDKYLADAGWHLGIDPPRAPAPEGESPGKPDGEPAPAVVMERARRLKWIGEMMRRTRRLRALASTPAPYSLMQNKIGDPHAWHKCVAGHVPRFIAYTMRSGVTGKPIRTFPHLAKIAVDICEARRSWCFTELGIFEYGEWWWHPLSGKRERFRERRYEGAIVMCPPGHGKTSFVTGLIAMWINENPRTQGLMLHAKEDQSHKNLGAVQAMFDPETKQGRRNLALYPAQLASTDNKSGRMRLKVAERTRQPTVTAYGVRQDPQGDDAQWLVADDIVPSTDADQPEERRRRFQAVTGVWFDRCRDAPGENIHSFKLLIGTPWHEDDVLMRLRSLAKSDTSPYTMLVSIQRCGGPKSKFRPLCAEIKDARGLAQKYASNPRAYRCAYMIDASASTQRPVGALRYYDTQSDQHARLMANPLTQFHLSIDPSATATKHSDKAGVVLVALGEVVDDSEGDQVSRRWVARVVDAENLPATQREVVEHAIEIIRKRRVDFVHVETNAGFVATAEMFEERGIDAIRHRAGGDRSKIARLKHASVMLDASTGLIPLFEFPGKRIEGGAVVCDPNFEWLAHQIIEFESATDKGAVDAITQLCRHFSGMEGIVTGEGRLSRIVQEQAGLTPFQQRKLELISGSQATMTERETDWFEVLHYPEGMA